MSKHFIKKLVWSVAAVVLVVGATCGVLWLINNRKVSIAETEEPTDEQFEQYFTDYAEMTASHDPENLLIVTSERRPETYGAVDVVDAPWHTYYLMYESAEARDEAYSKLGQDDSISVEKNTKMQLLDYNSWGIAAMGLDEARATIGYGNESVRVAIIDTGLDVDAFRQKYPDTRVETYDIETDSSYTKMVDYDGHGTHVAGTVTEGMPKNGSLYVIRAVRGESSDLYSADVTTALQRAYYGGVRVVNMSLGAYSYNESQWQAINRLKESGTVTVAAAGNDGIGTVMYPAAYDNTIAVSAVNSDETLADYSNYGATIDFAAPGTNIKSINGIKSGTSMATPHVTAAVATLKSFNNDLSFQDVNTLLRQHVRDLGEPGKDDMFGYGFIDLSGAEYCEWGGYCDEYGVFRGEAPVYARMEIDEATLTPVNYYSISNLMLTEVKLYTDETNYVTKKLQDIPDVTITGYGPETYGLQTVTITCEGLSQTVYVVNPDNYTPGWEYRLDENDQVLLTRYYDVRDYDSDHYDTSLAKLYVPRQINGKNVVELSETERTYTWGDNDEYTSTAIDSVFERSYNAQNYLREVYLPDTLTVIRGKTFWNFDVLEKVVMEADAVRIGQWAFMSDTYLRTVEGNIVELGENAFSGTNRLESVELAEGLTTIPYGAFSGCYSLTEIMIPSTVTEIENSAFYNAKSLERVVFSGNNVKKIGGNSFFGAESLSSITLPEGLEEIQFDAFARTSLTSVEIPASVTQIEDGAFSDNDNFARVTVDAGNEKYYSVSKKALMYDDEYGEKNLVVGTRSIRIPEGTTRIKSRVFKGFTTVGAIVMPDSVKYIDYESFLGCTGLTEIVIPKLQSSLSRVFEREIRGEYGSTEYKPLDVKLWVYNNNYAYDYAVEGGFNYQTIDASYARIVEPFEPGDALSEEMAVEFYQNYGTRIGGVFTNYTDTNGYKTTKTVGELVKAEYAGEVERFRLGDTYFNATYMDATNREATMRVAVTVEGEYPEYTVPTGVTAKLRTYLRDVALPEGFSWMEDDTTWLYNLGEFTYMVMYTPEDTTAYAPVENIPVTVTVVPGREKLSEPVITVDSKVHDGEWSIDSSLIHVTIEGLDADDYSVSGFTNDVEAGTTWAYIYINLGSDAAENYGFGDNYEDYYYYAIEDYEILPVEALELEVEDKTGDVAEYEVVSDGMVVTAEQACTVIITNDGGATYTRVSAVAVEGEENTYKFEFEITASTEALLVLRGDGNMDGRLSIADSNMINKSKVSPTLERIYRPLSELEELILDLNNSGTISIADSTLINRSLVSPTLTGVYQEIGW